MAEENRKEIFVDIHFVDGTVLDKISLDNIYFIDDELSSYINLDNVLEEYDFIFPISRIKYVVRHYEN